MLKVTSDWGGARTNGQVRYRKNGRFVKTPILDVDVCPACRRINPPKIEPRYSEGGFIDPTSMDPIRATVCHACGCDFAQYERDLQTDNFITALTAIAKTGWLS